MTIYGGLFHLGQLTTNQNEKRLQTWHGATGKMTDEIAYHMEISLLRRDLQRAKTISNISGLAAVAALIISALAYKANTIIATPAATTSISQLPAAPAPAPQNSYPEYATFQGITAQSITITDQNGNQTAVIDSTGMTFLGNLQAIQFGPNNDITASMNGKELDFIGSNSAQTSIAPGAVTLTPNSSFGKGTTSIYPGLILMDTPQNYSILLGEFNTGPNSVGMDILNDKYDKSHSNGGTIDLTSTSVTPNDISLVDASGVIRTSIGETPLVAPATGATSTTALSSISLFDKSNHLIWQVPQ